MRIIIVATVSLAIALAVLAGASPAEAQTVGAPYFITGCEHGEPIVPIVHLWNSPQRTRVVGRLSGSSRTDPCAGSPVLVREVRPAGDRNLVRVETFIGGHSGWLTNLFIGRRMTSADCRARLDQPAHIERCVAAAG